MAPAMILPLATAGPTTLWYTSRGAGAVTLVLLTVTILLGVMDQRRWLPPGWQRFVIDALHRNVSLLALAVLTVHVGASVLDGFAPIGVKDIVVPFASPYRPVWLGLGALAFDLMMLVLVSSVLRRYFGHRAWRSIHWLAYASWPVAVVHGLGTGTDARSGWLLALTFTCVAAVLIVVWARVIGGTAPASGRRTAALAAVVSAPIALAAWLPNGPLGPGWARKAGTPPALLGGAGMRVASARSAKSELSAPFAASLRGTIKRSESREGLGVVDLSLRFHGQADGLVDLRLEGQPLAGGGIQMTQSEVTLGPPSTPAAFRGRVQRLDGNHILATASNSGGAALRLNMRLLLDQASRAVSGTISAQPAAGPPQ
jgi:methionine sulfoxide reductase heme-binding subunit